MMCWVYDILIHACCGFTYLPIYGQSTVVRCLVVVVGTASYRLRKYLVCLAMTTNTLTHTLDAGHIGMRVVIIYSLNQRPSDDDNG